MESIFDTIYVEFLFESLSPMTDSQQPTAIAHQKHTIH